MTIKKSKPPLGHTAGINQDLDLCFPQQFTAGKNGEVPFELKRINLDLVNKFDGTRHAQRPVTKPR